MHLGSGILATVSFIQQKVHIVSTDGVTGYFFFYFSIWCYLIHVSSLLTYIHYNSNMGGRHRWLLIFRQPITNMY